MIIKLKFLGEIAEEPILSRAIKKFDINFSIIGGSIENLSTMQVGHLYIELSGDINEQKQAIDWFLEEGIFAEVVYDGI